MIWRKIFVKVKNTILSEKDPSLSKKHFQQFIVLKEFQSVMNRPVNFQFCNTMKKKTTGVLVE